MNIQQYISTYVCMYKLEDSGTAITTTHTHTLYMLFKRLSHPVLTFLELPIHQNMIQQHLNARTYIHTMHVQYVHNMVYVYTYVHIPCCHQPEVRTYVRMHIHMHLCRYFQQVKTHTVHTVFFTSVLFRSIYQRWGKVWL